ncbi:hypothetical protein [Aureivirga sp. CE67]|uniref:hypothetical protein n=1 Tax=Aureivirga sp. CE67 TaxID=1788983 RepID=UPI0018C9E1A7|nr:hypothetical protein [Aureivirga sp. CE67]
MKQELFEQLSYLKDCKGKKGTSFENLGRSIFDQIKNILEKGNLYITHLYIPKGSKENAEKLAKDLRVIFNEEIPEELFSFYSCFNGFEFRYINAQKFWEDEKDELDIDWDFFCDDYESLSYQDLFYEENDDLREEFFSNLSIYEDESIFEKKLSNPNKLFQYEFYGDSLEEYEYGVKKFIPPFDFLLHPENEVRHLDENDKLFFLDYYSDFRQVVFGRKEGEISIFGAEDYGADISKFSDKNIEKKVLSRL